MRTTVLLASWLCLHGALFAADPISEDVRAKTDDGAELHCIVSGPINSDLTPILFVPGYLMPAEIYEFQLRHFAQHRRVIAIDPRSQGKSSKVSHGHHPVRRARDIKAVADQFALKKFVLVGWSLAVLEALSFYDQFSAENLQALVFIDGDLSYEVPDQDAVREIRFLKAIAGFSQANRPEAIRSFVRSIYQNPPPAGHLDRVTSSALATSEDTALALLVNRIGFKFRSGFDKITVPVLVVVSNRNGNKDKVLADAKQIPKAEIHVMEQVGHALFVDQPQEFNQLLENFLRRNELTKPAE